MGQNGGIFIADTYHNLKWRKFCQTIVVTILFRCNSIVKLVSLFNILLLVCLVNIVPAGGQTWNLF